MTKEMAADPAAPIGTTRLRPWLALSLALGAIIVAAVVLSYVERYRITEETLAAWKGPAPTLILSPDTQPPLSNSLDKLKDKTFTPQEFQDEVALALTDNNLALFAETGAITVEKHRILQQILAPQELAALREGQATPEVKLKAAKVMVDPAEEQHMFELAKVANPVLTPLSLILMLGALIFMGWVLVKRFSTASDELDERIQSAGLIAVVSAAGLVGFLGMSLPWYSGRIFFAFFIAFTIIGSVLALLPRVWRALALTVVVALHFGGILVASTSLPVNGQSAWLPTMLYVKCYRPYLSGLYLTNGYHFYAPDPGTSTLVWVRIEYADHSARWVKFPSRPDSPTPLHYQRLMGMCEGTSGRGMMPKPQAFDELWGRRVTAGSVFPTGPIPPRIDLMPQAQYYPPNEYSLAIVSSMARHVALYYPHPTDPTIPVAWVKMYRLSYTIISPEDLVKGGDPLADKLKMPYYMGEYDPQGKRVYHDDKGNSQPPDDDPFLYWVVPMEYLPEHAGDKTKKSER
jgi:hypothetical protein